MKILIVSQYFWPENFRVNEIAKFLSLNKKYDVEILTGIPNYPTGKVFENFKKNTSNYQNYHGCKIHRVFQFTRGDGSRYRIFINYISFMVSSFFYSFFYLRKKNYDLIFTFGVSPITVSLISLFISFFTKSKHVVWVLDLWPEIIYELGVIKNKIVYNYFIKLVNYIYEKSDIILAQSNSFKQEIITKIENKKEKVVYFPSWPEEMNYEEKNLSKKIKSEKNNLNIMFTGNIGESQIINEVLSVAKELEYLNVFWYLIGGGRGKLQMFEIIKKLNLNNVITLDNQPLEEIPLLVNHADIMLVSLRSGKYGSYTIPGKIQTYLNFNKPILGHISGEGANIIKENNFGLVSHPGNLLELKNNVLKFYDLKKNNQLQNHFNNSKDFYIFKKDERLSQLNDIIQLNAKENYNDINLIKNVKDLNFKKNFILSGLNLAFLGSLAANEINLSEKFIHWPDGLFAKKFFKSQIEKISGRKLILDLKIPDEYQDIQVIGNLSAKGRSFLESHFRKKVIFKELPYANKNELKQIAKDLKIKDIVILTLPTPKQEIFALELAKVNKNFRILCIGGAINMITGEETPVPIYLEKYFEAFWRLRYETKRRTKRLIGTLLYYFKGEITDEFKKINFKLVKD